VKRDAVSHGRPASCCRVEAQLPDRCRCVRMARQALPRTESIVDRSSWSDCRATVVLLDQGIHAADRGSPYRGGPLVDPPLCIVVGGIQTVRRFARRRTIFMRRQNAAAIRNLYGWVSVSRTGEHGRDVKSIGALLEGRLGRVSLQQREREIARRSTPRAGRDQSGSAVATPAFSRM